MSDIKFNKKVIYSIDSNDFDSFVTSKYGGNFEFVAQHEANNYSSYEFKAPNMSMFFDTEAEDIRSGKYRNHSVYKIIQVLFEDGHIEEGNYLIDVNW